LFPPEIGILIPLAFFEICWWVLAVRWDYFSLFHDRYLLSITMVFGATVAGKLSSKDVNLSNTVHRKLKTNGNENWGIFRIHISVHFLYNFFLVISKCALKMNAHQIWAKLD
jgi:hypothetical protein